MEGVLSGWSGGHVHDPSYEQVCTGKTGHAEVIQVAFDASLTFRQILEVFFAVHDPTTLNRQGGDVGTQYRSVILYRSPEEKATPEQVVAQLNAAKLWPAPIVTEIVPLAAFYAAEDYHEEYFTRNPQQGYCRAVVEPKVAKFRKQFLDRLKKQPV